MSGAVPLTPYPGALLAPPPANGEDPLAGLLPAHVVPKPDEALTSWLVRLAAAHHHKLHTFCALLWPGREVWTRDFDRSATPALLADLAARTGVPAARAAETHLDAYAGILYPVDAGQTRRPWVLRAGVRHRTRRRAWTQACPVCLATDAEPYFRLSWRLACATACTTHERALVDRCGGCGRPLAFFRGELGSRGRHTAAPIWTCPSCGADWRRDVRAPADARVSAHELPVHATVAAAVRGGAVVMDGVSVPAREYFAVLRQLCRAVLSPGRTGRVRRLAALPEAGAPFAGVLASAGRTRVEVELRPLAERRAAVVAAAALLERWPEPFLADCARARVWSTELLRDGRDLPAWYAGPVRAALYRPLSSGARRHPRGLR